MLEVRQNEIAQRTLSESNDQQLLFICQQLKHPLQ